MKLKTSVTLSATLLEEIDRVDTNRSAFWNGGRGHIWRERRGLRVMPMTRRFWTGTRIG